MDCAAKPFVVRAFELAPPQDWSFLMQTFRALAIIGLLFAAVPTVALAQTGTAPAGAMAMKPTKEQVQTALKATNPSLKQMRELKPMMSSYQSQVAAAPDDASKKAASQQLMTSMATVLSPGQMTTFKQSLMSQMMAAHS
jgi:hypothetical protein